MGEQRETATVRALYALLHAAGSTGAVGRSLALSRSAGVVLLSEDRYSWIWMVPGATCCYLECGPLPAGPPVEQQVDGACSVTWIENTTLLAHATSHGADYDSILDLVRRYPMLRSDDRGRGDD